MSQDQDPTQTPDNDTGASAPEVQASPDAAAAEKAKREREVRPKPAFVLRRTAKGAWADVDTGAAKLATTGDAEAWILTHGRDGETYRACQGYPAVVVRPRAVVLAGEE